MSRLFALLHVALLHVALLGLWLLPAAAEAQALNLLAMGEDADEDSVPRGNRIYNRVLLALSEEMNLRGFAVFDETAVTMDITDPTRVRRIDAELIDVARAVQAPPLDVVAVFTIYASARESAFSDVVRPDVRIPGRLLDVRTGQLIGAFEVDGLELPPLPVACDRECLLETVGDSAAILGTELADALALKLEGFVAAPDDAATLGAAGAGAGIGTGMGTGGVAIVTAPAVTAPAGGAAMGDDCGALPTAFVIRFDGFDDGEVSAIEEYVNAFSCVQSTRPVRASARSAEYWHETRSDDARLNRNLRLMLEHMGVEGQVRFSGNAFVVTKVATR